MVAYEVISNRKAVYLTRHYTAAIVAYCWFADGENQQVELHKTIRAGSVQQREILFPAKV